MSLKDPNIVNPRKTKRMAVVISSEAVSTTTGWLFGFWRSKLAHPYFSLGNKSQYSVDATLRLHALGNRVENVSLCGESLAAVTFGSSNTS
jgi:hypothetical protein